MAQQFITGNELSKTIELSGNNTFGVSSSNTITINGTTINCPNNLNFDSNTFFIDSTNNRVGVGTSNASVSLTSNGSIRVINQELQTVEQAPNLYANYNTGVLVRNETPIIDSTGNTYSGIYTNQKVYANSASTYTSVYGSFNNPRAIGIATTSRFLLYGTYNRLDRGGNEPLDVANNPNTSLFGIQNVIRQAYSANANTAISTSTVYGTLNQIAPQIGTMVNVYGTLNNILLGTTTSSSANVTNYYANYSTVTVGSSNTSLSTSTLSNYYGLYLAAPTVNATGAITNRYGIYEADNLSKNIISGSLGVGTTNPTNKFNVVDNINLNTWNTFSGGTLTNASVENLDVSSGSAAVLQLIHNQHAAVRLGATRKDATNYWESDFSIAVRGADTNMFEAMRIKSSGNVGIGTSSPGSALEIKCSRTSSTSAVCLTLSDNVTGGQTNGVYKAIRSISNNGSSISEIRFLETDGTNNNTGLAFATQSIAGGLTERLRIDYAGNVSIGSSTSSGYKFLISGSDGACARIVCTGRADLTLTSSGAISYDIGTNSDSSFSIRQNGTYEFLKIGSGGTVKIPVQGTFNTTTPGTGTYGLHFNGQTTADYATGITWNGGYSGTDTAQAGIYVQGSGTYGTKMYFATTDSYAAGAKTRMMVDHLGNLSVGTTSGYKKVTVNGSVYATDLGSFYAANGAAGSTDQFSDRGNNSGDSFYTRFIHTTSGGWSGYCAQYVGATRTGQYYPFRYLDNSFNSLFHVDVNGNLYATAITETSSITLKENVHPLENALESILQLNSKIYDRKDGSSKNEVGLIAEEVNDIIPNIVSKDENGNPVGIHYTKLTAYLIESIKSLKKEIEELKNGNS